MAEVVQDIESRETNPDYGTKTFADSTDDLIAEMEGRKPPGLKAGLRDLDKTRRDADPDAITPTEIPQLDDILGDVFRHGKQIVVAGMPAGRAAMIQRLSIQSGQRGLATHVLTVAQAANGRAIHEAMFAARKTGDLSVVEAEVVPGSSGKIRLQHLIGPNELDDSDFIVVILGGQNAWQFTVLKNRYGKTGAITWTGDL